MRRNHGFVGLSSRIPRACPLMDSQEAAMILAVRKQQVQRWAKSGRLESFRAGRRLRFTEAQLMRFIGVRDPEHASLAVELAPVRTVSGIPDPPVEPLDAHQPPGVPTVHSPKTAREGAAAIAEFLAGRRYR